jgi:hypothetical protein
LWPHRIAVQIIALYLSPAVFAAIELILLRTGRTTYPEFTSYQRTVSSTTATETPANKSNPPRKIISAIFSYISLALSDRMETYDKRLEAKKRTIAAADISSIMVSFAIFDNFIKLSITKTQA